MEDFKEITGETISRGEIYWYCYGDEENTSVQQGKRPCVIISNNKANVYGKTVTIIPFTTADKKKLPTHVDIESGLADSIALCEQILTISKSKLGRYIGEVTESEMREIEKATLIQLDIIKQKKDEMEKEIPKTVRQELPKTESHDLEIKIQLAEATARANIFERLYKELLAGKVNV